MKRSILYVSTIAVASVLAATNAVHATEVTPVFVDDNPSCTDLGYDFGFKVEQPGTGTFPIEGLSGQSVTITSDDGISFDWTSTLGIDAVLVKGGPNANAYVYDPPSESFGDTDLHAPINPNNQTPFGLSHIDFCYDLNVVVDKTVVTSFNRLWHWMIAKAGQTDQLNLSIGQTYMMKYTVTVATTGFTDSDWAVSGNISVQNPAPVAANVTSVTDTISPGIVAAVSCPDPLPDDPYVLASGDTLMCTYSADLPDGTPRTNTATVTTSGTVDGGTVTKPVTFSSTPTAEQDECVDVTDSKYGALGEVCAADSPKQFTYELAIGPFEECGTHNFENTASFVTNDTGAQGSSSWTVVVTVADCEGGCTLTPGYWKTHSLHGPAAHPDDAWYLLSTLGPDEPFFLSDKTYYQVLWTQPKGDPYYILAHAYIAAKLNILDGASSTSAVDAAIAAAEAYFATAVPGASLTKAQKAELIGYATTLDQYNNGLIGPGHCSEDGT